MKTFLIATLSIILSVAAQFSLKAGMSSPSVAESLQEPWSTQTALAIFTERYVILGFLLYGLGAIAWLGVLAAWDVTKAYPLVGMGFALTIAVGLITGEQLSAIRIVGIMLIGTGVLLISRS